MKLFRRAVVATAATAAVLTIAPAAHAAKVVHDDAAADVVAIDDQTGTQSPAPEVTDADIRRTVIKHGAYRVNVKVTFTDLAKTADFAGHLLTIRTNESLRRNLIISAGPGLWRGERMWFNREFSQVRCTGLRHELAYDTNILTISIPRACLSKPRWVQVGTGAMTGYEDESGDDVTTYVDDARRDGAIGDFRFAWSPRVRKG